MGADIDTEVVRYIIELDQVGYRKGIGQDQVRLEGHEPGDKIPLDQVDIVQGIGSLQADMFVRSPDDLLIKEIPDTVEVITTEIPPFQRQLAGLTRLIGDPVAVISVFADRQDDAPGYLKGVSSPSLL